MIGYLRIKTGISTGAVLGLSALVAPLCLSPAHATDGTFTGSVSQTAYGPVQVQITISKNTIVSASALQYPNAAATSLSISQQAIPYLIKETLAAQSANIQGVGGASYTSQGWYNSLVSALAKSGNSDYSKSAQATPSPTPVATPTQSTKPTPTPVATPTPSATPSSMVTCAPSDVVGGKAKSVPFPVLLDYLPAVITFHTNCGDIAIKTVGKSAPLTLSVFTDLITNGYFDQTLCHRLTTSGIFVVQCGDPTATGAGKTAFSYADENLPASAANNYPAGTVAMANSGPNTNGSQFFFTYQNTSLNPSYSIWGHITEGLNIVQAVAKAGVTGGGNDGMPAQKLVILSASVLGGSYSDASLSSFMINGFNVLSTQSAITLPATTVNASVIVKSAQPGTKVAVTGDKNLTPGKNVVTVTVTAQDGVTTQSYSSLIFLSDVTPTPSASPSPTPSPTPSATTPSVITDPLPILSPAPVIKHSPTPTPTAKTLTWYCVKGKIRIKQTGKVVTCPKGYKRA